MTEAAATGDNGFGSFFVVTTDRCLNRPNKI